MRYRFFLLLILCFLNKAMAVHPVTQGFPDAPGLTGPLIAPAAHVTTAGHATVQPFFGVMDKYGKYDQHWKVVKRQHNLYMNAVEVVTKIGVTKWMDIAITPVAIWNISHGKQAIHFSQCTAGFDFQLLLDAEDNYLPALKLGFRQVFPFGKINHLNSNQYGVDAGRIVDSYQSQLILVTSRLFHFYNDVWFNLRLALVYAFNSRVHVRGLNAFGGASDTNGYVYPPQEYGFDLAYELTFTKHWAFACDIIGGYAFSRKFKGNPGTLDSGEPAVLTNGSKAYYQLAPAIEYNWNKNIGIISGAWFTVAGRNSTAFATWVTELNVNF